MRRVLATMFIALGLAICIPNPASAWEITNATDSFGSPTSVGVTWFSPSRGALATLDLSKPKDASLLTQGDWLMLFVRCIEGEVGVGIKWSPLDGQGVFAKQSQIAVRFDNGKPQQRQTSLVRGTTLMLKSPSAVISRLSASGKFAIRAVSTESRYVSANFLIDNLQQLKAPFRKAGCNI